MRKIQLNKTIKQSGEKKMLNIIVTNKVKRRNSGLDKKEKELFFRLDELRWDTV